jgi:TonB-linked SusC/RagA family outer membrane protein
MHLVNAPLQKAFDQIRRQSDYRVIYDNSILKNAHPVTLSVEKESLNIVLDKLFRSQPFNYKIQDETIIIVPRGIDSPESQSGKILLTDSTITGSVVADSTLQPLEGATITVNGTNLYTVADNIGNFKLALPDGATGITVSYVGFQTRYVTLYGQPRSKPLVVTLRKTTAELKGITVVSTGYETLPRERLTGSFEKINGQELNERITTDAIGRLEGVSSILFDKDPSRPAMTIRGYSSINSSNSPLIVVNNFPYDGSLNDINPNDVESITILKDAAAASIWGTRAGNGVIVITTKSGQFNAPLKMELTANLSFISKPNPDDLRQIGSGDFIDFETFLYNNGYYSNSLNNPYRPPLTPVVELLNERDNGRITAEDANRQIENLRKVDVKEDFNKYIYQTGINQQYFLNLSAGTANNTYYISGGYDRNADVLDARYSRVNGKIVDIFKPFRNLQVKAGLSYIASNTASGRPAYGSVSINGKQLYPYAHLADASGKPLPFSWYRQPYIDTAGEGKLLDWNYYPLDDYRHATNTSAISDILADIDVNYQLLRGLSIDLKYMYEKQQTLQEQLYDAQSFYARNLINSFTQIDFSTGQVNYAIPPGGIIDRTNQQLQSQNGRAQLNYNKSWLKQNISAIGGAEIREIRLSGNNNRVYGYDDSKLTEANVDLVNQYPDFITGGYSAIPNNSGQTERLNHFVSMYLNASYTYDNRYTVSGSARRDASNLFGVNTNDKWTPLWSLGAGWNLSNESFYKSAAIPSVRLRATYGYSGNVNQAKSAVPTIYYVAPSLYTNFIYAVPDQFANPDLRWEKTAMLNVGIDFSLRNNILSGSIEYYQKKGKDLLGNSPADYTAVPTQSLTKNVANMRGNGWEANLNAKVFDGVFKWTAGLIFSYRKTEVTKYYLSSQSGIDYINTGSSISPIEGNALYSVINYRSIGLDHATGDPQGIYQKQISKDYGSLIYDSVKNLVCSGPSTPSVYGYFNNSFSFKGFTLTPCVSYKFGYYFQRQAVRYADMAGNWRGITDYSKRWKKPGDEVFTDIPSLIYPLNSYRDLFYSNSEALVRKADNIRLEYVNLSYSCNTRIGKSEPTALQIYAVASNLGILWKADKEDPDPEHNGTFRPSKNLTIGLKIIF